MEYISGGPICNVGQILDEEVARCYFIDIIEGLNYRKYFVILNIFQNPVNSFFNSSSSTKNHPPRH